MKLNKKKILMIALVVVGMASLMLAVYFLPPVHSRVSWRVANLRTTIRHFFNPPGEHLFTPGQQAEMEPFTQYTQTAEALHSTETIIPAEVVTPTKTMTATLAPLPTQIPASVKLEGVVHEYQDMNNCGPATLSMALSYWGWKGTQRDTQRFLRPHPDDRNVMPYEMVNYVRSQTDLDALQRWGGDIDLIKRLIAAGFPVVIERDMRDVRPNENWTGHYGVVTGYDDARSQLTLQDSFIMADYPLKYDDLNRFWRAFNYVFIVIYPPDREAEVLSALGPHADAEYTLNHAAQKAQQDIAVLSGKELFFAWFNYGTSLVNLGDYYNAAAAYDHAYEMLYPSIPVDERPWRMMWYQTGPYFAYYHTGRYQDVIVLANLTLIATGVSELEETWVWRGRARLALGNVEGAVEDFRTALIYHPSWQVAEAELRALGIEP